MAERRGYGRRRAGWGRDDLNPLDIRHMAPSQWSIGPRIRTGYYQSRGHRYFYSRQIARMNTCGAHCPADKDAHKVRTPPKAVKGRSSARPYLISLTVMLTAHWTPSPKRWKGRLIPSPTKERDPRTRNDPHAPVNATAFWNERGKRDTSTTIKRRKETNQQTLLETQKTQNGN